MHEEEAWLLVEHVAVQRGDLDAAAAERADHFVHFAGYHHEVAADRRLAVSGRLEVDCGGGAHRRRDGDPVLDYVRRARDAELIDAAVDLAGRFHDRVEIGQRKIDWHRLGRRRRRRTERRLRRCERAMQRLRELHRIAMAFEVNVHDMRRFADEVIVYGRLLDAAGLQGRDHRIDFRFEQHEIAHDHGVIPVWYESDPRSERERRLDLDAVRDDVEIAAWERDLVNVAGLHRARASESRRDVCPLNGE